MTKTDKIFQACKDRAKSNKHGHMTSLDVYMQLDDPDISIGLVSSVCSKNRAWWRQGVPRKVINGGLVKRELLESHWKQEQNLDRIRELQYQLNSLRKEHEALKAQYNQLITTSTVKEDKFLKAKKHFRELVTLLTHE